MREDVPETIWPVWVRALLAIFVGLPLMGLLFWGIPTCAYHVDHAAWRYTSKDGFNPTISSAVVSQTNSYRSARGLATLSIHPMLTKAAQKHSRWMAQNDILDHTGHGGSRPSDRIAAEGYCQWNVSENILEDGGGSASDAEIMHSWITSPGHYANIIDPQHRFVGVGSYRHNGILYVTQNFGLAPC